MSQSPRPLPPRLSATVSGSLASEEDREERVPMTRLRQTIARRLKDAQNTAAMLTTFNEVDMSEVIALRARHKDALNRGMASNSVLWDFS